MTVATAWLGARRPAPPDHLAERLRFTPGQSQMATALTDEALTRLAAARARTGRVRDSAFRLLEADALLTYACEAALETDHPEATLRGILAATNP